MKRILTASLPAGALLLLTACAGMGGAGQAQNQAGTTGDAAAAAGTDPKRAERGAETAQQGTKTFEGRVVDLRTIEIGGAPHVLARLEAQGGQNLLVDLGRAAELRAQNLRLHWGEQISGRGIPARLGRFPVLAATRLSAGDQQVNLTPRTGQPGARGQDSMRNQQAMQQRPPRLLLRGRIVDTRQVAVRETSEPHNLIKVRTRRGVTVADLGPHSPETFNLEQGDWVAVYGEPARISGKPVVLAQHVAEFTRLRR